MQMYWKTFDCSPDPSVISYSKCIIVEPERSLLFAETRFNQELVKPNATFTLFILRESSKTYHKIVHMSADICKIFKMPLQNQIALAVFKSIMKNSNVPEKCPVPKVRIDSIVFLLFCRQFPLLLFKATYYFRNINVATFLPSYLPKNDFKVQLNFAITPKNTFFNITVTGRAFEPTRVGK